MGLQTGIESMRSFYPLRRGVRILGVADRNAVRLSRDECQALIILLCGVLADDGRLAFALTQGTWIRTFQKMTRAAHQWASERHGLQLTGMRVFNTQPAGLGDYWPRIQAHARHYGAGSALLGMAGRHDHWSCIRSMSDRMINLVDSAGIQRLHRERCTIGAASGRRQHILLPTQTLLITDDGTRPRR